MKFLRWITAILLALLVEPHALGASGAQVAERISRDAAAGRPLIAHVVVVLCDNANQGIVPVPAHLGNGQDPDSNLYWGAAYGVRTFLTKRAAWTIVDRVRNVSPQILERIVFRRTETVAGASRTLYIVAEAWDGREMRTAIDRFLALSAGGQRLDLQIRDGARSTTLMAGGAAHLVAFIGHNGLMDFSLDRHTGTGAIGGNSQPNSAVVLACASKPYFLETLRATGTHPLLLTTGLMAPEAYTLDAVVRSWLTGADVTQVREAAAAAYDRYQHSTIKAARRLFATEP